MLPSPVRGRGVGGKAHGGPEPRALTTQVAAPLLTLGVLLFAIPARAAESPVDAVIAQARQQRLYLLRGWQRLGHWRPTSGGGFRSEIDGPDFFLAKGGKTDPEAELTATLRAFFEPARTPEKADGDANADKPWRHPLCRFPARAAFLKTLLPLEASGLPQPRCPKLETWIETLSPGAVTLVFASSYLNSPASMYGHTFLRIDRSDGGPELLSYAISYAAVPGTNFPPAYALLGLFGGFPGRFSSTPYYMQVQTYSEVEHRDLWEYPLEFTRAQVLQLVSHAWELGQTFIDYFFLDENCSYQLLTLLEVADPSLRLSDRFSLYTVPIDTARALLEHPGLVGEVRRRPSHVAKMLARREALSGPERRLVKRLVREGIAPNAQRLAGLSDDTRRLAVLDSAHDLFVYRRGLHARFTKEAPKAKVSRARVVLDGLVRARAAIPLPSPPPPVQERLPPDEGHASARLGGDLGLDDAGPFLRAMVRPAYHDPTDPQEGFDADTALEFFATRVELRPHLLPDPDAILASMDVIRIASLTPYGRWIRQPSWRLRWSAGVPLDRPCRQWRCAELRLVGGPGLGVRPFGDPRLTLAFFADLDLALTPGLSRAGRLGVRIETAAYLSPFPRWRTVLRVAYRRDLLGLEAPGESGVIRATLEQAFLLDARHALRLALELDGATRSARLGFARYF